MNALRKYWAFVTVARRAALRTRGEVYGRVLFYAVFLGVFSALWRAIAETGMPVRSAPERLVWYLAVSEWVVLSTPPVYLEIEEEIRRGDVACRLPRPVSYLASLLAEGLGKLSVRLPLLGVFGFVFAWSFTGVLPEASALLAVVPLVVLACFVLTAIYVSIGFCAFWLGETAPIYWVVQKLLFVLGGLMLPLEAYPPRLVRVAEGTPFPSLLHGPASLMLEGATKSPLGVAASLALWCLVILGLSAFLCGRARRRLELSGG